MARGEDEEEAISGSSIDSNFFLNSDLSSSGVLARATSILSCADVSTVVMIGVVDGSDWPQ
jgi:hypothetical protein